MGKPKIKDEYTDHNFSSRNGNSVKYLVIHYTGDTGATAKNEADYFKGSGSKSVQASAHLFVDSHDIYKSVKFRNAAWHCRGSIESSHHPYWDYCYNSNSIGIEMCVKKKNGKIYVPYAEMLKVWALAHYVCKLYDIPLKRIIRHYDVSGKACPDCYVEKKKGTMTKYKLLNGGTWKWFRKHCYAGK